MLANSKRRKLAQVGTGIRSTLYRSSRKSKLTTTQEHRRMRRQRKKRNLSMKNHKLLKHAVSSILFTRPERKWKNLRTSPVFLLHADLNQRKTLTRNCLEKVTVKMRARIYNEQVTNNKRCRYQLHHLCGLFRMSADQMSPLTAVRGEKNFKKTVKYCKAKDAILIGLFRSLYLRNSLTVCQENFQC